jgi:hypothetical protein
MGSRGTATAVLERALGRTQVARIRGRLLGRSHTRPQEAARVLRCRGHRAPACIYKPYNQELADNLAMDLDWNDAVAADD